MNFLETTTGKIEYQNKDLQRATQNVFKLGDAIKKNWFQIAYIVAEVDRTECYKDDGFDTVHAWTEKTFGIKKSASYSLLTIGKEYTRQITNASGRVTGYGTNLLPVNSTEDFSKTQVEKMLPAGHELATQLVKDGEITPDMPAKKISEIVKSHTKPEPQEPETEEPEETTEMNEPEEKPVITVVDVKCTDTDVTIALNFDREHNAKFMEIIRGYFDIVNGQ